MELSLNPDKVNQILFELSNSNKHLQIMYHGDSPERQPVHTLYGGAQLFKSDSIKKMGTLALNSFKEYAPDFVTLAKALQLQGHETLSEKDLNISIYGDNTSVSEIARISSIVYSKIEQKLIREAVEDFRIDFEDGFGNRSDNEEDQTAQFTAEQLAKGMEENTISPFIGIRVKSLTEELKNRAVRTLDIFLTTLLSKTGGKLPENFVITLPKVTTSEQVIAFVKILELFEESKNLEPGILKFEIMVETTQSIFNTKGESNLLGLVTVAKKRCRGAHFGAYDYTASCDITAKYQTMDHPACDFVRHMMKVALAGTGVWLSDGATNVMPVGPYRGKDLTVEQKQENMKVVHGAWKQAFEHTMNSLRYGFYQGWDLHPAQIPIRYAAVYTFFLYGLNQASIRLKNFIEKAAQASLVGDVFDDAATGQGLLNYFIRAINCGAITENDLTETGLTLEEIQSKSFLNILKTRKKL